MVGLGMEVIKTITLNLLEPTRVKQKRLSELVGVYKEALSYVVAQGVRAKRTKLQSLYYKEVRGFGLHSQIAVDLFKDAAAVLCSGGEVRRVTVPYNIPRSAEFKNTKHGSPVVCVATLKGQGSVARRHGRRVSALHGTPEAGLHLHAFQTQSWADPCNPPKRLPDTEGL